MPRLSEAQLAERLDGLGATDIATAAGVNPFQSPFELYLTKIGELDPDATIDDAARDRMERGHRLEDVALEWDRDLRGEPFERVSRTIWHPKLPFVYCHPDARRKPWRTTRRLIEVKTSLRPWKEVPRHVEAQVQVQMACTGAESVEILVLGFDGPPRPHLVERDDVLIGALEGLAQAFWTRVQLHDPPPVDGSLGASRWLDRTKWRDEPEMIATNLQRELLADLVRVRAYLKETGDDETRLINQLKLSMAGAGRLNAPGIGRVNWTAPVTVHSVAWKEVASAYRTRVEQIIDRLNEGRPIESTQLSEWLDDLETIEGLYTSEREQRSFRLTPDEREDT